MLMLCPLSGADGLHLKEKQLAKAFDVPFTQQARNGDTYAVIKTIQSGGNDAVWAMTQLFFWSDIKSLYIVWIESNKPEVRLYAASLLMISWDGNLKKQHVNALVDLSKRFKKEESEQRVKELDLAMKQEAKIAKIILTKSKWEKGNLMSENIKKVLKGTTQSKPRDK